MPISNKPKNQPNTPKTKKLKEVNNFHWKSQWTQKHLMQTIEALKWNSISTSACEKPGKRKVENSEKKNHYFYINGISHIYNAL